MNKISMLIATILMLGSFSLNAQVAINTDGSIANSSAMLDVQSSSKGFLPPRMTQAQRDAISSPATGLMIYQTNGTAGFYYYNGSVWSMIPPTLTIGQSYQGGIIFWLDDTGQHGLIAAQVDQSSGIEWLIGTSQITGAMVDDGLYAGAMNTTSIVIAQLSEDPNLDIAATVCSRLIVQSYDADYGDWYLPSKYELALLVEASITGAIGGLTSGWYWSSTQKLSHEAWKINSSTGQSLPADIWDSYYVRAIRAF